MDARPIIDVSVCVATYRRPEGLSRLLASLERQKLPDGVRLECVVVDNDPAATGPGPPPGCAPGIDTRWLHEPRRNIAHARNAALEAARGEWLAFVDDDEEVDEGWLAALWRCARSDRADAWFGPVLPRLEEGSGPGWLDEGFFARPRHATGTPLREGHTNNALAHRSLFRERRFDPAFGRSGGSDTALFRALRARGARLAWCDEAIATERVPAERRRLRWLVQRAFRGGCVMARIEAGEGGAAPPWSGTRAAAGALVFAAAAVVAWPLRGRAGAARWLLRASTQAGRLWTALGGRYEEYTGW